MKKQISFIVGEDKRLSLLKLFPSPEELNKYYMEHRNFHPDVLYVLELADITYSQFKTWLYNNKEN